VKKTRVERDSSEEVEVLKMPAKAKAAVMKAKLTPGTGVSGGSGGQVGTKGSGNGVLSEAVSLQLMAPLLDISRSLRRVV
jgi:hypothetical protein